MIFMDDTQKKLDVCHGDPIALEIDPAWGLGPGLQNYFLAYIILFDYSQELTQPIIPNLVDPFNILMLKSRKRTKKINENT